MSIAHKLRPSELVTDQTTGATRSVSKPVEELDTHEKELHARTMTAVDRALRSYGVSLTGAELQHVSAELADFVQAEIAAATSKEEPEEPGDGEGSEEGKPRKKRR